jgi:DNA-binding transcriptional regulator YiaG
MEQRIDVKRLRNRLGLTQVQLGAAIGVDQSTVSNWENGDTKPRGPALKLLLNMAPAASEATEASAE